MKEILVSYSISAGILALLYGFVTLLQIIREQKGSAK